MFHPRNRNCKLRLYQVNSLALLFHPRNRKPKLKQVKQHKIKTPFTAVPPKEQGAQAETSEAASNVVPCTALPPKEQEAQAVTSEAASIEFPCTTDPIPDKEGRVDTTVAAQDLEEKSEMSATCKETDVCKEISGTGQALQGVCALLHFSLCKVSRISTHYS